MKIHQILAEHLGENAGTAKDPIAVWTGQVDLSEEKMACVSYDDNRLIPVKRYEVREVELPDWLSPEEWMRNRAYWKWNWGMGVEMDWPESWQRSLLNIKEADKLACIRLLKTKNFRSDFRRSLRDQLVKWMETPSEERHYRTPFSTRQWNALVDRHLALEAKYASNALYYNR